MTVQLNELTSCLSFTGGFQILCKWNVWSMQMKVHFCDSSNTVSSSNLSAYKHLFGAQQPVTDECKHELHYDWLYSHNPSHTCRSLKGTVAACLIPN